MRAKFALVVLLSYLAVAQAEEEDGKNGTGSRLVGGTDSPAWGHPYLVYFMIDKAFMGEGLIIDPYTILTDGRSSRFGVKDVTEEHRKKVLIIAGENDHTKFEPEEQWREICKYSRHPDYDDTARTNSYAVISLSEPFIMNQFVNSIRLAPPGFEPTFPCLAVARGTDDENKPDIRKLHQKSVNKLECPEKHSTKLCSEKAQCHYDDGGPLLCKDGSSVVLAGIISYYAEEKCSDRSISVFADIANLPRDWLKQEMKKGMEACRPAHF